MMMTKKLVVVLIVLAGTLALLASQRRVESASLANGATSALAVTTVVISNFQFQPQAGTVKVGAVVTWVDKEGSHTVTSDNNIFDSGGLTAGKTFSYKFVKPGTYKYHCSIHGPDMSGTVTVKR
jgi:plastocyanin